ncbi:NHLP leader peptide family RiPP precursor [Nocardia sp. NPDC006044]|uniref:NHLP leader peptide family RiPP precursor n=1 Tax=Nocardia sp. NPDC006044 TaxID=3364306 RepID=UPI00368DD466
MTHSTILNRAELEQTIVARAQHDTEFKQRLLADPQGTVLNELGIAQLPDSPQWRVVEESEDVLYLVLPLRRERIQEIVNNAEPLTDGELTGLRVAGMNAMLKCDPGGHSDAD